MDKFKNLAKETSALATSAILGAFIRILLTSNLTKIAETEPIDEEGDLQGGRL